MNDLSKDLRESWNQMKSGLAPQPGSADLLIQKAQNLKRKSLKMQWGNLFILSVSLVAITAVWRLFFPFQESLSHLGVGMMLGSLGLRVLAEAYTVAAFGHRDITQSASAQLKKESDYLKLRNRVNGPLTYFCLSIYTLGVFLLAPEFGKYLSVLLLCLIYGAYLAYSVALIWLIRRNVKQETSDLMQMLHWRKELLEKE